MGKTRADVKGMYPTCLSMKSEALYEGLVFGAFLSRSARKGIGFLTPRKSVG
jgi:hypothetical protein